MRQADRVFKLAIILVALLLFGKTILNSEIFQQIWVLCMNTEETLVYIHHLITACNSIYLFVMSFLFSRN